MQCIIAYCIILLLGKFRVVSRAKPESRIEVPRTGRMRKFRGISQGDKCKMNQFWRSTVHYYHSLQNIPLPAMILLDRKSCSEIPLVFTASHHSLFKAERSLSPDLFVYDYMFCLYALYSSFHGNSCCCLSSFPNITNEIRWE